MGKLCPLSRHLPSSQVLSHRPCAPQGTRGTAWTPLPGPSSAPQGVRKLQLGQPLGQMPTSSRRPSETRGWRKAPSPALIFVGGLVVSTALRATLRKRTDPTTRHCKQVTWEAAVLAPSAGRKRASSSSGPTQDRRPSGAPNPAGPLPPRPGRSPPAPRPRPALQDPRGAALCPGRIPGCSPRPRPPRGPAPRAALRATSPLPALPAAQRAMT